MLILLTAALAAEQTFDASLGLAYWRLGINAQVRPGLIIDMPWKTEGDLLRENAALKPQLDVNLSPAYGRVGGRLRFEPLAVVELTPYVYGSWYFGNFQTVIGYEDWSSDYGKNVDIAARVEADPEVQATGRGVHAGINGALKAKAGPAIVVINGDLSRWWVRSAVEENYAYFFEREQEVLMRLGSEGGDTLFALNGVLLLELDRDVDDERYLRVGNLTTWRRTLTADDELLRTGLLVTATHGRLTHVLLVQPYLRDRAFETALPPFTAYQVRVAM